MEKFKNLDSLRTIAFFSTFLAHAFWTESEQIRNSDLFEFVVQFRQIFSFGVPFFFVLSGFLITYLILREQEHHNGFNLTNFYMRRILRIWPVYFVVLLVGFVLFPLMKAAVDGGVYAETANPWMYIAFLSNFDQIIQHELPMGVGLGPTWSVAVEEQFYLIWPIFLILFKRSKFITPILITIIVSIILSLVFKLPSKHTVLCSIYLATGGIFGYLMFYKKPLVDRVVHFLNKIFPLVIGLLIGLMFVSTKIDYSGYVLLVLSISVVMGLIIIQQCSDEKYQIRKIPFLERVGKYTYGLYLYHVICNFIINTLLLEIMNTDESITLVVIVRPILSLALSGIISYLSYNYFEKKFLSLKSRFR